MSLKRHVLHSLVICQVGSFSYTLVLESLWLFVELGVCLTRHVQNLSGRLAGGEFLLHALCLNLIVGLGVSLTRPTLESVWSLDVSGVSVTRSILKSVSSFGEWGLSLTKSVLRSVS